MRKIGFALGIALFLASGAWLLAAPVVGPVSIAPQALTVGPATIVIVTALIEDPTLIPTSVNLQQIDAAGKILGIVGTLNDAGLNGDVVAGDKVFTIRWSVQPTAIGQLRYQVSAGFRGLLRRVASSSVTLDVRLSSTIAPILDTSNAVEAVIGRNGGSITATSATGVTIRLTVPELALVRGTTLRLTPITSVAGMPWKGVFVGGAQLEPEGLRFAKPLELTITPPNTFPYGKYALGFAYSPGGERSHLYPHWKNNRTLTLSVFHFSGYGGVTIESDADFNEAESSPSSGPADDYEKAVDMILADAETSGETTPSDATLAALAEVFEQYYQSEGSPALDAYMACAQAQCPSLDQLLDDALLALERMAGWPLPQELWADVQTLVDSMFGELAPALVEMYDEWNAGCAATTDCSLRWEEVGRILALGEVIARLGGQQDAGAVCGGLLASGTSDCSPSLSTPTLQIFPSSFSLEVGESRRLSVIATDEHGEAVADPDVVWQVPCLPSWEPRQCNVISFNPLTNTVSGVYVGNARWVTGTWRGVASGFYVQVEPARWAGPATEVDTVYSPGGDVLFTCTRRLDAFVERYGPWADEARFAYQYNYGGVCSNGTTTDANPLLIMNWAFTASDGVIVGIRGTSMTGTADDDRVEGVQTSWGGLDMRRVVTFSLPRVRR